MLIIVSGVSGVGKNTIIKKLIERRDNLKYFKSATTRARREGENNYLYLSKDEFLKRKANNEFFETEDVHGDHYGTLNKDLDMIISDSKNDYIKDIDVNGNAKIRKHFDGKAKAVSIFLEAPDEVLYNRLIDRGESIERAKIRLSRGGMERARKNDYDIVIENIDMNKTIEIIEKFLKESR